MIGYKYNVPDGWPGVQCDIPHVIMCHKMSRMSRIFFKVGHPSVVGGLAGKVLCTAVRLVSP